MSIACELGPMQATLVPESREELTTEGGLNLGLAETRHSVGEAAARLREAGIRVSLFVDPTEESLRRSKELGVEAVELPYGRNTQTSEATSSMSGSWSDFGLPRRRLMCWGSRCTLDTGLPMPM